jgi:dipeptidase E
MKKMFLASSFVDVADKFIHFEGDLRGKSVTFIPTASKVENVVFYVNAGKKALEQMGLAVDELGVSTASSDEIISKINKHDFIYVSGGNTFFLLQELKRTGADQVIAEAVHSGKLYIGESAGAIITAATIEYAGAMDSVEKAPDLESFDALNLVNFYTVPHYGNPPFQQTAQKIMDTYSSALDFVPISNNEAIVVNGNIVKIERNEASG